MTIIDLCLNSLNPVDELKKYERMLTTIDKEEKNSKVLF
jgi:hypothetical protein